MGFRWNILSGIPEGPLDSTRHIRAILFRGASSSATANNWYVNKGAASGRAQTELRIGRWKGTRWPFEVDASIGSLGR